ELGTPVHRISSNVPKSAATVALRRDFGRPLLGSAAIVAVMLGFIGCGSEQSVRETRDSSAKTARPAAGAVVSSDAFTYSENRSKVPMKSAPVSSPGLPPGAQAPMGGPGGPMLAMRGGMGQMMGGMMGNNATPAAVAGWAMRQELQ